MTNELDGRFYFKLTSNGNLIGEWSNRKSKQSQTESCDLRGKPTGNYLGKYDSTWLEDGKPQFAVLTITRKQGSTSLFALDWKNKAGELIYQGEGMLCDCILIGDYRGV